MIHNVEAAVGSITENVPCAELAIQLLELLQWRTTCGLATNGAAAYRESCERLGCKGFSLIKYNERYIRSCQWISSSAVNLYWSTVQVH
jgi:hypothetical protein